LSSPSPTPIYLPITLPISNRDEKLNLIPIPNGFGYSHPRSESVFLNKKKFFLRFNGNVVMHYPTICAHFNISLPNNSIAPLTINKSSYIMTIIKPYNMTYHYQPPQQKQNYDLSTIGRVWVWVCGGYIYPCFPSRTRILKSGKTQTQSNRGKPVKLGLV